MQSRNNLKDVAKKTMKYMNKQVNYHIGSPFRNCLKKKHKKPYSQENNKNDQKYSFHFPGTEFKTLQLEMSLFFRPDHL